MSKIDDGYTSVVWQCLDVTSHKTLAVKFIREHSQAASEVCMLARFGHPNVVKMLDCFEWNGLFGIVMPLVDMDLHRYVHSELYDTSTMCEISRQSARGLHHLHLFEALHADLKPENIGITVVRKNDDVCSIHVHLLDLGSSKRFNEIRPGVVVSCTRGYQAPETLSSGSFTSAVDVWALGKVYEELISHAMDIDEARRRQGQLTRDMLQVSSELRPTARDVLRRLGDGYQLVWENGVLVPNDRLLWVDGQLWTSILANLPKSPAMLFDHLIINDSSHYLHRIAALAQSTTRIVQLENAFWFLREAAVMEQDGVVFESTVMSCLHHFHAHVDTTW